MNSCRGWKSMWLTKLYCDCTGEKHCLYGLYLTSLPLYLRSAFLAWETNLSLNTFSIINLQLGLEIIEQGHYPPDLINLCAIASAALKGSKLNCCFPSKYQRKKVIEFGTWRANGSFLYEFWQTRTYRSTKTSPVFGIVLCYYSSHHKFIPLY